MSKYQHRDRIAKSISWGHWFTLANIIIALLVGTIYLQSAELTQSTWAAVYMLVSWLGHFAFLPFVFFIILLFPLCILFPYSRFLRGIGALLASFGMFALLLDALFFSRYGFHLNTYALAQLASDAEQWFTGGSFVMLVVSMLIFMAIFAIQLLFANLTWKRLDTFTELRSTHFIPALFISCFLLSHSIHIWADATLYTPITQQDDLFPLSYPTTAKTLMTRHGWIDISTFERHRSELISASRIDLRYPASSLLCARQPQAPATLYVIFNRLDDEATNNIGTAAPSLRRFQGTMLGNPSQQAGFFQAIYAIPDRYQQAIMDANRQPVYISTLEDFGYDLQWYRSPSLSAEVLPKAIQEHAREQWPDALLGGQIAVLFADVNDLDATLSYLSEQLQQPGLRIMVTAAEPSHSELTDNGIASRLTVPLWYHDVDVYAGRELALLEDLMPSTLRHYISCAERFEGFSSGIPLARRVSGIPRVMSLEPHIYIFEANKTSILNQNGEVSVFSPQGEPLPNEQPSTTVLINSLNELQRFALPR